MNTMVQCECCLEGYDPLEGCGADPDLGAICPDCASGVRGAAAAMGDAGCRGIHHGPCPDAPPEEEEDWP